MGGREPAAGQTILVADDDPDLVTLVSRRLSKAGYRVITAGDGEHALAMVADNLPHLAVLDMMMPKLTGIEVMNRLRANPHTRHVPVILISAGFESDPAEADPSTNADGYVKKPFGPHDLTDRVAAVLSP